MSNPKWVYLGEGHSLTGIPARHLTERDIEVFSIDEKVLKDSDLYVLFEEPKEKSKHSKAKKEGE